MSLSSHVPPRPCERVSVLTGFGEYVNIRQTKLIILHGSGRSTVPDLDCAQIGIPGVGGGRQRFVRGETRLPPSPPARWVPGSSEGPGDII